MIGPSGSRHALRDCCPNDDRGSGLDRISSYVADKWLLSASAGEQRRREKRPKAGRHTGARCARRASRRVRRPIACRPWRAHCGRGSRHPARSRESRANRGPRAGGASTRVRCVRSPGRAGTSDQAVLPARGRRCPCRRRNVRGGRACRRGRLLRLVPCGAARTRAECGWDRCSTDGRGMRYRWGASSIETTWATRTRRKRRSSVSMAAESVNTQSFG